MSDYGVLILGSNSSMPAYGRHPSAQYLRFGSHHFLIDCGEGTQARLQQYRVNRNKISHIFISHLHGDHVFGLAGLIGSYFHFHRHQDLSVFGPPGLEEMIRTQLRLSYSHINFGLHFTEINPKNITCILDLWDLEVIAFPIKHRIPTIGFLFRQRITEKSLNIRAARSFGIDFKQYDAIKKGADGMTKQGELIPHVVLTEPPKNPKSFAYCSDTAFDPSIIHLIQNVNLLYHEATFAAVLVDKAIETGHSTTLQAAEIAAQASVGKLLIGHFSSRYKDIDFLETEAQTVFKNTIAVKEGTYYDF